MATSGMRNVERLHLAKVRKRIEEIRGLIWVKRRPVQDVTFAETMEHLPLAEAMNLPFQPARDGMRWGSPWSTAWFRLRFTLPSEFAGKIVALRFDTQGECIIFRDGEPVQGLDPNRKELVLTDRCEGGEAFELYVEAGASSAFGRFEQRVMQQPELAVFLPEMWGAYMDLEVLENMVRTEDDPSMRHQKLHALPEYDTRRARIVYALIKAVDVFDYQDTSEEALVASAARVRRALRSVFAQPANASCQTIACMGHAHIDVAWLWPLAETVRKCGRTFSNVLALMERYPQFVFCQSQPVLYEFARDRYPTLYRRILEKAKTGQWRPTGCMWVEADCNVPSGESLVRQILVGKRFFQRELGYDARCLWLPDVFGYSASLPQILKRSGVPYFLTQKISWSQFTTFPHHSFHWEGIDGTRVLAHFPPANTYNSDLAASREITAAGRYAQKDRSPIHAALYGFGDGGGGPTAEMIERMHRYKDLEGMPRHEPMSAEQFFDRLADWSQDLPVWVGELYLELHRGTLTTQARNKRYNRKCEFLLRDAELLCALQVPDGAPYPSDTLEEAWKTVLTNQFHDIIPGSSIDLVYQDSDRDYTGVLNDVGAVRDEAAARYAARLPADGGQRNVVVLNTLSWERTDTASVELEGLETGREYAAVAPDGEARPAQLGVDGRLRFRANTPSMGHTVYRIEERRAAGEQPVAASRQGMENDLLRLAFDDKGCLVSLFDKRAGREAIGAGGAANEFLLFEDKPHNWDAWDIDVFYNDKLLERSGRLLSIEALESGPVRGVVRIRRAISRSVITQDVVLYAGCARVDFETTVEWGDEKEVLLKVAFPVSVRAERARYEIQFGNLTRPTHWNMPRDLARFEVAAQKWADLSEADYGVALLNDCKYGHDVRDNVIRLTLLRATKSPDTTADVNRTHFFSYALFPHAGGYENGVVRAGYELNVPQTALAVESRDARAGAALPARLSHLGISGTNVVIDTVKKAEDDDGVIVRMYEAHGCRGARDLSVGLPVKRAVETDLMENEERELSIEDGRIRLDFDPFQFRTVKLKM